MASTYFTTMPQPRYTIESLTAKAEDHRDSILPTDASTTVIDVSHTIEEAQKGDAKAFFTLAVGVKRTSNGRDGKDILQFFFSYIDENAPPRQNSSNECIFHRLPLLCLLGIGNFGRRFDIYDTSSSEVACRHWNTTYEWIKFFYETEIIGSGSARDAVYGELKDVPPLIVGKQNILNILTQVFMAFLYHNEEFKRVVQKDHEIYRLIASLWIQDGAAPPNDSFAADALVFCKMKGELEDPDDEREVVAEAATIKLTLINEAAGGDNEFVAKLCLFRLQQLLESKDLLFKRTQAYIRLMTILITPPGSMKKTFLELDCIPMVCHMLHKLGKKYRPDSGLSFTSEDTAGTCLVFLSEAFNINPALKWVKQALLRSILRPIILYLQPISEGRDSDVARKATFDILGDIFPQHMALHKYITPTCLSIDSVYSSEQIQRLLYDCKSLYDSPWSTFYSVLLERVVCFYLFELSRPPREVCNNRTCGKTEAEVSLRRCSRCLFRTYCSTPCHVEAWKQGGHSKECPLLTAKYGKRVLPTHKGEHAAFLDRLSHREIRRHIPGLREMARREFKSASYRRLGICVDFTTYPPTLSLFRPETLRNKNAQLNAILREHPKRIDSLLYRVKYPGGEYIECKTGPCVKTILREPQVKIYAKIGKVRTPALDLRGYEIQASYDEVDELVHRLYGELLKAKKAGEKLPHIWSHPLVLSVIYDLQDYWEESPFLGPMMLL